MNPESTHSQSSVADMPEQSGRFAGVYKVLQDAIAVHAFPGCAFGVFAGGETVLEDALGRFTYESDSPSVEPNTVFDVASITKVVSTTAAAMLLYQRGLLDLDTPLGDLLPGFVVGRDDGKLARQVTVRHLLAHNSGLPGYVEFFRTAATPTELYRACLELPIEATPGERSEYSDPGFMLLGKALEVLTRENLAVWAQKEVFEPLGLAATGFSPPVEQRALIPPTEVDSAFRHRLIQGEVQDENAWILNGAAGHAGLFSNVADLLRFAGRDSLGLPLRRPACLFSAIRSQDDRVLRRAAGSGGKFAGAGVGHALAGVLGRASFLRPIHRASWIQRLFALDRPRCRGGCGVADQPNLARPAIPVDQAGPSRFSRRDPGSVV